MSLDNPCLKYFVPEKQNRGGRRRTQELEPSSRLSRQVSRDSLCRDGKPAEARESAAPRHRRAPRRARGSTRGTACSRGSRGGGGLSRVYPGPERSHKGSRAGPRAGRSSVHFRFPPAAEESDSATPVVAARGWPHRARNAAQEPGSPRRGPGDATQPRVPRTREAPGAQRVAAQHSLQRRAGEGGAETLTPVPMELMVPTPEAAQRSQA